MVSCISKKSQPGCSKQQNFLMASYRSFLFDGIMQTTIRVCGVTVLDKAEIKEACESFCSSILKSDKIQ